MKKKKNNDDDTNLRVRNGWELFVLEIVYSFTVVPQIQLGAHEDDGRVAAVVLYLRIPLWEGQKG